MIEQDAQTTPIGTGHNRMELATEHASAPGRLEYVFALVEQRRKVLDEQAEAEGVPTAGVRYTGPAYELHVYGDARRLLVDEQGLAHLEHIAQHGGRCGVVTLLHGEPAGYAEAFAERSSKLAAALIEGRHFRAAEAGAR